MFKIAYPLAVLSAMLACSLHAAPAQAQRVFVAATGSDGNPCTFASPCRSFQHAHDVAAAGGEIDVLDPAGYGAVTITKTISIQGHGFAGITVPSGGAGITINAPVGVSLNGLIIDGAGGGIYGIVVNSAGNLTIANCMVQHVPAAGIFLEPNQQDLMNIAITNTILANNWYGIAFRDSASVPAVNMVIDHVEATGGTFGIFLDTRNAAGSTIGAVISHSIFSNNANSGIYAINGGPPLPFRLMTPA
jgi:hypothetical protein